MKISGILIALMGAGALMLGAAGLGYLAVAKVEGMITAAAQQVREERDAHWQLEIQKVNTAAATAQAEQAKAIVQIQADATERVDAAEQQLEDVRKQNAALPNGGNIGLSAERGRLLPK